MPLDYVNRKKKEKEKRRKRKKEEGKRKRKKEKGKRKKEKGKRKKEKETTQFTTQIYLISYQIALKHRMSILTSSK